MDKTLLHFLAVAGALLLPAAQGAAAGEAGSVPPDKGGYSIFRPVPDDLLRELSPDRPDRTESPHTVDAGRFQLEMDFATFTRDTTDRVRTREWNVAPLNLKAGLTNNVDVQFVFDGYLNVRTDDKSARETARQSGAGDFTTRLKINLWGNDGGRTAFAILPFVKFPTNTGGLGNESVEGGVLFPLAVELPAGFGATLETGASVLRNDSGGGRHAEFVNSVTVSHAIAGRLGGYVEFFTSISTERHSAWVGTVDAGLVYAVTADIQFDCGCNFGVTRASDDVNPFAGVTVRF